MKLAAACALLVFAVPAAAPVGFEAEGVRVGEALVVDTALQLKDAGPGHVLVSASVVEPLSGALTVALSADCSLVLQPGIRVARTKEGFSLTAHNRRRLDVDGQILMTPVVVEVVGKALRVAGARVVEGGTLAVRRVQQDDTDENLKKLQEEAKRLQKSLENGKKPQEPTTRQEERDRLRRKRVPIPPIFGDIFLRGEGMSDHGLLPLFEASPIGF